MKALNQIVLSLLVVTTTNQIVNVDPIVTESHGCLDDFEIICIKPSPEHQHFQSLNLEDLLLEGGKKQSTKITL